MKIRILTDDQRWISRNRLAAADGMAVVTVADSDVERVTFAGQPFVRFDLQSITRTLPSDCGNRWNMIPTSRIVGAE